MKDRNLEALRREHKSKFKARNTSSVKNQLERGGAALEETKEETRKYTQRIESAVNPNGQFLAKSWLSSWLSRYAYLLVIAAGLVGLISFLMMYMRPTFNSEGNQSAISSVNTVPTESENKIEILTEGNSAFIEKNREVDFPFEEILELIKTMNQMCLQRISLRSMGKPALGVWIIA